MIVVGVYSLLISCFIYGFIKLPKTTIDKQLPQLKFSIVIPFRNEEQNLKALLKSIEQLEYNNNSFEVLLIDDESTDNSVKIIKNHQERNTSIRLLSNNRNSNSPKKDAIQVGIKAANFNWVLTTDADCILPKNWLLAYNSTIQQKNSLFIAGPIQLKTKNNFTHQYQKLDIMSLLGSTMAGFGLKKPMMCNAANMGFHKKTYLNIYTNNNITSGDDVFTLESFVNNTPKKIHYLNTNDAIVTTYAENDWKTVIQQRIRWAAKSTHYNNLFTKIVGLIVLGTQLSILIYLFIQPSTALSIWIVKAIIDFVFIRITARRINETVNISSYIKTALIYPFLTAYIGVLSLFGGYTWKSRKFKK